MSDVMSENVVRNPRHIVMLNKAYPPWMGGIERHVRDISEALCKRGWTITVLACNDARFETRETIRGVRIIRMPCWANILSQPIPTRYLRRLRELAPDLVHVHVPFPLAWFAVKRVNAAIPIVCTWHSDIVRQRRIMPFLHPFEQRFLSRCSRILPTSEVLLNSSDALKNHRDRCTVIPLSVSPGSEIELHRATQLSKEYKNKYGERMVLFVGRLVGYKGLPYLIDAMSGVHATLLIAGDGPDRTQLEKLASQISGSATIHFLGQVSELEKHALYRVADVLVLPSISCNEAFGYVLLEAMMHGCPTISTDLPTGVRWVNEDGISGLTVPPENANALAQAIHRILDDDVLHEKLSKGARDRAARHFNFDNMITQIEQVYRNSSISH